MEQRFRYPVVGTRYCSRCRDNRAHVGPFPDGHVECRDCYERELAEARRRLENAQAEYAEWQAEHARWEAEHAEWDPHRRTGPRVPFPVPPGMTRDEFDGSGSERLPAVVAESQARISESIRMAEHYYGGGI